MTEVRELLPPDVLDIVLDAYQVGLRYTYSSCALISLLTLFSTFFIQSFELATKITAGKKK
jgi:hypothetical protein